MVSIHIVSYNKSLHTINAVKSILDYPPSMPFEVRVLENGSDLGEVAYFTEWLMYKAEDPYNVHYRADKGNVGFAKGMNLLGFEAFAHWMPKYIIQMNNDMFFAPHAIDQLIEALESDASLGIACSNLINGGLFDKYNPNHRDIYNFAARYKSKQPLKLGYGASNTPWAISTEFYKQLADFDVWHGQPLPFNSYRGIWDESIDPYIGGWYVDWDVHARLEALGQKIAVVEGSHVYHYDHCSVEEVDQTIPGWTEVPRTNYVAKYGSDQKAVALVKKEVPTSYPTKVR